MVRGILRKLESEGRMGGCSLSYDRGGARMTVFGRDIIRIGRSSVTFLGGETGREEFSIPLEAIREIEAGGRTLFRKKKRIERVYPRGRR